MNDEQEAREKLHIVKMLRMLAMLNMQCGVTHPVKNNAGEPSSCLVIDEFETLFFNSYYTYKDL